MIKSLEVGSPRLVLYLSFCLQKIATAASDIEYEFQARRNGEELRQFITALSSNWGSKNVPIALYRRLLVTSHWPVCVM